MAKLRKKDRKIEKETKKPKMTTSFVPVAPRTRNQEEAIKAIRESVLAIITGTAGTGKTLIAVSEALRALDMRIVEKLVLIRPIVSVGESLGYLPGGVNEKIEPYSTSLLYYIDELCNSKGYAKKLIDLGIIEVVPIALIRGRTFKDSFILMDEAQNVSIEQMHAVLTRLGEDSQIVLVGDVNQLDLKKGTVSGLADLLEISEASDMVGKAELTRADIQRNEFLKLVHDWYEA
jgi:phosphate starvation-inducible PhoH-like protein